MLVQDPACSASKAAGPPVAQLKEEMLSGAFCCTHIGGLQLSEGVSLVLKNEAPCCEYDQGDDDDGEDGDDEGGE